MPALARPSRALQGDRLVLSHDHVRSVVLGLYWVRPYTAENLLVATAAAQAQRHRLGGNRHGITEFAHQGFTGMCQRFQPGQAEETAGSLDGVHQTKDVI